MRVLSALAVCLLPGAAIAVGSDDSTAPIATETTVKCENAQIWDEKTQTCVNPQSGALDDDMRYRAVRELAWAGQPEAALVVLGTMEEGETDRVLTYLGFAHRKAGRIEAGMAYYTRALARNPDNLLARSYMGQALVDQQEMALASQQLDEIRARGGAGTWAETALAQAITFGVSVGY